MAVAKIYNSQTGQWEAVIVGTTGDTGVVQSDTEPSNTDQLWLDTDDTAEPLAIPAGGSAGQILQKSTDGDYDTAWSNVPSHNYIINGAFDIWQRGDSGTGSNTYISADRWLSFGSAAINKSIDVPEPSFEYSADVSTQGIGNFEGMATRLESSHCILLASKTVTLSMYVKANNETINNGGKIEVQTTNSKDNFSSSARSNEIVTFLSDLGATADSWTKVHITGPLTADAANGIQINILPAAGSASATTTLKVTGVQLEAGSVATPFKRNAPSLQGELAACQRYYQRWNFANNRVVTQASALNTTRLMGSLIYQRMRATPTIIVVGNFIAYPGGISVTQQTPVSGEVSTLLDFDASGFTAAEAYQVRADGASYIETSGAEL